MLVEPNDRVFMSNFIFCRISSRSVRAAARTTHCLTPVLNGSVILMVCVPRCVYPSVCWRRCGRFLHSGCPAAVTICAQVFDWTAVSPSSGWGGNLWVRWPSFHLFRRPPHGLHCSCTVCLPASCAAGFRSSHVLAQPRGFPVAFTIAALVA